MDEPCDECGAQVRVIGFDDDGDVKGWLCNACDEKVNPEDYEFLYDDDGA